MSSIFGALGTGLTTAAMASNPVGWAIGIGTGLLGLF